MQLLFIVGLLAGAPLVDGPEDLDARLRAVSEAHPAVVERSTIGSTSRGRPIPLITLSTDHDHADVRPALLVVSGLNSLHRIGPEAALGIAEAIARDHEGSLSTATVYVIPCVNIDALGRTPLTEFGGLAAPRDADSDGRTGEDPADDLNGDGRITMMRIRTPPPGSGIRADMMLDPDDPRLLRKPDPAKGEAATHAILIEGLDNDGDGQFNEDGLGGAAGSGVDLDRNFPPLWPEFRDGSGRFPVSEAESLSLVQFMQARHNIAAVLVLGPHDNLVNIPQAGRMDQSGSVPIGLEEGDRSIHEYVAKLLTDAVTMQGVPKLEFEGSFAQWAYADAGVMTFATPAWARPELPKIDEEKAEVAEGEAKAESKEQGGAAGVEVITVEGREFRIVPEEVRARAEEFMAADPATRQKMTEEFMTLPQEVRQRMMALARPGAGAAGEQGSARPVAPKPAKVGDTDDAKWLAYSDQLRGGAGFVEWAQFDHSQLGLVEIGGFVPGFRWSPPPDETAKVVEQQAKFAGEILSRLPRLVIGEPIVTRAGPGLWRVQLRITNDGYLPTTSAIGAKASNFPPTLAIVGQPVETIVAGQKVQRFRLIAGSGGIADADWLIAVPDGTTIRIEIRSPFMPNRALAVELKEAAK